MNAVLPGLLFAAVAVAQLQPSAERRPLAGMSVVFSVDQPLDVPGAVLQPGTYVLRLKREPSRAGDLAQLELLDAAERSLLAELYAIQSYYPTVLDNSIISYYGQTSDRKALKAWNVLTAHYTEWIVYPRAQAAELSKVTSENVISMPDAGESENRTSPAPPPQSAIGAEMRENETPLPATPPAEFPKTAGNLPVVLWVGFTALAAFVVFRVYRNDTAGAQNARNNAVARRAAAAAYRTYKTAHAGRNTQA
jgi:hypothetical protein